MMDGRIEAIKLLLKENHMLNAVKFFKMKKIFKAFLK